MTKAKEALEEIKNSQCGDISLDTWLTAKEALELLDKVQRGGDDVQQIDELQTLSDDEWMVLTDKYILIERE